MSEHITSIPLMLRNNHYNISLVAKLLGVDRKTVAIFRDDEGCQRHIVVRGRLMTETRAAK